MAQMMPSVEARWSSPYSADAWARAVAFRTPSYVSGASASEALVLGPALPVDAESRLAEAYAVYVPNTSSIQWMLSVRQPPDEAVPAHVQDANEQIGGRDGLAKMLVESLGDDNVECEYHIHHHVSGAEWSCSMIPRSTDACEADARIHKLGDAVRVERIGYRFDGRTNGILEIAVTYLHKLDVFAVDVVAFGKLAVLENGMWLPSAASAFQSVCDAVFERRGGVHE